MKKLLSVILAVFLIFGSISIASAAESTPEDATAITLNGDTYLYSAGTTITYTLSAQVDELTENGQFYISYPDNLLEFQSAEFPVVSGKGVMGNASNGWYKFHYSVATADESQLIDFRNGGVVVILTFNVISAGSGEISIDRSTGNFVMASYGVNIVKQVNFTETMTNSNYEAPKKELEPLTINLTRKNIFVKKKTQLKVTGGSDDAVVWKSSKPKVASVDSNGVVTGLKKGTAVISATKDGEVIKCTVTVKNPTVKANKDSIKINNSTKIVVKNAVGTTTYKAMNNKAKVNAKGKVTGLKKGTAKIKVNASGVKFIIKIKVK